MKFFIYGNLIKNHNFIDNFHIIKEEPENYKIGVIRGVKLNQDKTIKANIVGKQLCLIGSIDDETGKIENDFKVLVDYDEFLPKEDVKSEVIKYDKSTN